jgi:hypothetical protein
MPFTKGTGIEGDKARLASWRKRHSMAQKRKYRELMMREAIRQEKQDLKIAMKMQKKLSGYPHKSFSAPRMSPLIYDQPLREMGPFGDSLRKTGRID